MSNRRKPPAGRTPAPGDSMNEKDDSQDEVISFDAALESTMGDETLLAELLGLFRDSAREHVEGIEQAVRAGSAERLVSEAHGLKGSAATIGARRLAETARVLEELGRTGDLASVQAPLADLRSESARAFELIASLTDASGAINLSRAGQAVLD
jgi:HPt (histidine-containing phosphotransfer) domain-containing protein